MFSSSRVREALRCTQFFRWICCSTRCLRSLLRPMTGPDWSFSGTRRIHRGPADAAPFNQLSMDPFQGA
jgi:hypothetical protein